MSAPRAFAGSRCVLFFPASRPELYEKAARSGADAVCADLEDAVAAADKEGARASLEEMLGLPSPDHVRLMIRINHPDTDEGVADLRALARALGRRPGGAADPPPALVIPKVGSPEEISRARRRIGASAGAPDVVAMIETVQGLDRVEEIARAETVRAVLFGGLDLSIELGAKLAWEPLLYARSRVVHAARLGGVAAIDMPWLDLSDAGGLRGEADRARALGFNGKAAIHPDQVPAVLGAFAPTESEIEWARRVTRAAEAESAGAFALDGAMVDRPVVEAARRILAWGGGRDD